MFDQAILLTVKVLLKQEAQTLEVEFHERETEDETVQF